MLLQTIVLDAAMSVSAALSRMAQYGLWTDAQQPTERRLKRDPWGFAVTVRRQLNANVLWYTFSADFALRRCAADTAAGTVQEALQLQELPSEAPQELPVTPDPPPARRPISEGHAQGPHPDALIRDIRAWPRLDAPGYTRARVPFTVVVGLAANQQSGVTADHVRISMPEGVTGVNVTVNLISAGVDAPDGWTRVLHIERADPTAGSVYFTLVGREPSGPEPLCLTTLEAQFEFEGAVCSSASRPLVIGREPRLRLDAIADPGTPWLAQPPTGEPLLLVSGEPVADLTIEIAKPDRNSANGDYVCRLLSPHPIEDAGPHDMSLGNDARTFAKSVVEQVRQHPGAAAVDNVLRSIGDLLAEKLPKAVFRALEAVGKRVAPRPPAVLIVSTDSYVPWELARIPNKLDATRPPFLGAQTVLGRWLRDPSTSVPPPAHPPATIQVREMAVMVGVQQHGDGELKPLPGALSEGAALVASYDAIALEATAHELGQLLNATLEYHFKQIGGVDAVHFAGHGGFDPERPDAAVPFLSDGEPLSSLLFRDANYGGERRPLLFLNACMVGVGGELLGDLGGFPGNCLRGGFGALIGALWEVDDTIASQVAAEFWHRALPLNGDPPEAIGAILRDLRAKYLMDDRGHPPDATYLSYVYYGHPLLKLHR